MAQEDRQHPRYAHEASVTVSVDGRELHGRTQNVSRGGACAELAEAIAVGTELHVDLQLVFEDDSQSEALRLPARVAWCTKLDDETYQVGVAFKPMNAELAKYVGMFLRFLDSDERVKNDKRTDAPVDEKFG